MKFIEKLVLVLRWCSLAWCVWGKTYEQCCCLFRLIFYFFFFFYWQQHGKCACQRHLRALQGGLCPCRENRQQQWWAVPRAVLRLCPVLPAVPWRALLRGEWGRGPLLSPCPLLSLHSHSRSSYRQMDSSESPMGGSGLWKSMPSKGRKNAEAFLC